jgi:hypothetical protein
MMGRYDIISLDPFEKSDNNTSDKKLDAIGDLNAVSHHSPQSKGKT